MTQEFGGATAAPVLKFSRHSATIRGVSSDSTIERARMLREESRELLERARLIRAQVGARVLDARYVRVFCLARGASEDAIETRTKRCPHCQSEVISPSGHVAAHAGLVKVDYRCDGCGRPFVFVRRPLDFGPSGPITSPASR